MRTLEFSSVLEVMQRRAHSYFNISNQATTWKVVSSLHVLLAMLPSSVYFCQTGERKWGRTSILAYPLPLAEDTLKLYDF